MKVPGKTVETEVMEEILWRTIREIIKIGKQGKIVTTILKTTTRK